MLNDFRHGDNGNYLFLSTTALKLGNTDPNIGTTTTTKLGNTDPNIGTTTTFKLGNTDPNIPDPGRKTF